MKKKKEGGRGEKPPAAARPSLQCKPASRQSPPVKWGDDLSSSYPAAATSDWGTRAVKEGQEEKELVVRSRSVRVKVEEVELGSERATQTNCSPRAVASLISDHGGIRNCAESAPHNSLSPHPSIHNNVKTSLQASFITG